MPQQNYIMIRAHGFDFVFRLEEQEGAWYDLDHVTSATEGRTLRINADREVYACLTEQDGTEYYGIIGDGEDEAIPDNFGFCSGDRFVFYDHPETRECYI